MTEATPTELAATNQRSPPPVFVYGSLMSTRVLQALLQRVPVMRRATLQGFSRHRIIGQIFPGILPSRSSDSDSANHVIDGVVLLGLNARELEILDYFEDDEYIKQLHQVVLLEDEVACSAGQSEQGATSVKEAKAGVKDDGDIETIEVVKLAESTSSIGTQESRVLQVTVYVWGNADAVSATDATEAPGAEANGGGEDMVLYGEWDYDTHFAPHEDGYVTMCEEFAACNFKWSTEERWR